MNEPAPNQSRRFGKFRNWTSLTGAVIAVASLFAFLFLFAMDLVSARGNPYMGLLTYGVSPLFFLLGSALLGLGAWLQRRRGRRTGAQPLEYVINLARPRDKRVLIVFITGSVTFLLVTAMGSYNTYHYTESVQFCGTACHVPMKPEYTTYLTSPHARVACTECHVGSGASYYVKSKINGMHQLYGVVMGNYHRPVRTPVKNLRPAQETCEQCHWPQKFVGNLDRTYAHFLADETNTPFTVRLLLKVGGADPSHGPAEGIHWHMNVANKIEYLASDEQRQVIPWVKVTGKDGHVTEYMVKGFKDAPAQRVTHLMDCMDCHNRPAHDFRSPNDAVDLAMSLGTIDTSLPWAKSNVVAALTQPYSTEAEALSRISTTLHSQYTNYARLDSLVAATQAIYQQTTFPEMKTDWRDHPNNIGHKNWAGCFRCHDGLHQSADGKQKIAATSCNACHLIVAQGSGKQLETLNAKGLDFFHIDGQMNDFSCDKCHTGAFTK